MNSFATDTAPVPVGPWFAFARGTSAPNGVFEPKDLLVDREGSTRPRVKINERGTTTDGGGITGSEVVYAQTRGDKWPRLLRYDLRTGGRTALPDAVNRARYEGRRTRIVGDVSADGPWILFSRRALRGGDYGYSQAVLYHRGTRKLRVLGSALEDFYRVTAGQVQGRYATYMHELSDGTGAYDTEIGRYDIRTGRTTLIEDTGFDFTDEFDRDDVTAPAVSANGTMYFWRSTRETRDSEYRRDLVRLPVGGSEEVVCTTVGARPYETFVRDLPDGSTQVFYSVDGDIFRLDL